LSYIHTIHQSQSPITPKKPSHTAWAVKSYYDNLSNIQEKEWQKAFRYAEIIFGFHVMAVDLQL
jgi:hypothetical protein